MESVPPEIWEKIFGELWDPIDCWNIYNVNRTWREIMMAFRAKWMFVEVFPLILAYISKGDVCHCRDVCRRWRYAVDHFLENNSFHRPALGTHSGNHMSSRNLSMILLSRGMAYHSTRRPIQSYLLTQEVSAFKNHSKCRMLHRALRIDVSREQRVSQLETEYLRNYGRQVYFLKNMIMDLSPEETLLRVMELLAQVPNLKMLNLECHLAPPNFAPDPEYPQETSLQQLVFNRMSRVLETQLGVEQRQTLQNLETVKLHISGLFNFNDHFVQILLPHFSIDRLRSLWLNILPSQADISAFVNLVDLSLTLESESRLAQLVLLISPIRKLSLIVKCRMSSTSLFRAINQFHKTLRNLELEITPYFYDEFSGTEEELRANLESFPNREALMDCVNLKSFTLIGCRPLSLNFLCCLSGSLEYLYMAMDNLNEWEQFVKAASIGISFVEELDVLEKLRYPPSSKPRVIYGSNVWRHFPRLKTISVHWLNDDRVPKPEAEYRRDIFEMLSSASSSDKINIR